MDLTQLDYGRRARPLMVDSQLRPNRISDPRLIRAARSIPRERFLPPHLTGMAYADEDVALPGGRNMMEPLVLANLIQLAKVRHGERVLVVGAGAGYGAALLDACGRQGHRARRRSGAAGAGADGVGRGCARRDGGRGAVDRGPPRPLGRGS